MVPQSGCTMGGEPRNWLERILWPREEHRWERILVARLTQARRDGAATLVEPGCGPESSVIAESEMRDASAFGFDIDPRCARNPHLTAVAVGDICRAPVRSGSADVVLCRWVLEHVADPTRAASECYRMLAPGGRAIILVPNILNPALLCARLTPTWVHTAVRGLSLPAEHADNCPAYYRANTPARLRKVFEGAGFRTELLCCADQAFTYLNFSRLLLPLGLLFGRLTDIRPLRWLKGAIVAEFVKPEKLPSRPADQ